MSRFFEETRERFEERAFGEYFIKSITRVNDSQFPFRVDCDDKATFTRRGEDGYYIRDELNLLWLGWNLQLRDQDYGN